MTHHIAWDEMVNGVETLEGDYIPGLLDICGGYYQEDMPEARLIADIIVRAGVSRDLSLIHI